MIDDDLELGEDDSEEELEEFPPPERKIVTQPYDLSISTLVEQWEDESLVLPEIQREYVWDNPRGSRLIESLLLNIPIPVVYFAETEDAKWEIFDGHQRIRSIVRYINNEFALSSLTVLGSHNRLRFHQLPIREQRFLKRRTLRAVVISSESHPNMKFETFERLNTGSVVLNAQEIRNSLYRGPFNALLRELVQDDSFRRAIGTSTPRKRMVDEELALRFFALRAGLKTYRPPLKRFLNNYMNSVKDSNPRRLRESRDLFQATSRTVADTLGDAAFRVADAKGRPTERAVNRSLFEAQMLAFSWLTAPDLAASQGGAIHRELAKRYRDSTFRDALQRATGDRARTLERVSGVVAALNAAGFETKHPSFLP